VRPETKQYLDILFQPGEVSCYTDKATGTSVSSGPQDADLFVCVNALHPYQDLAPSQPWHRDNRPRRADVNVVSYRNFVLELDKGTLEEQYALVTARLPVSTITFSGSKSLHFIVSLEQPLTSNAEYRTMAERLLTLVPEADPSCRNPSRLTRIPGPTRPDTGLKQKLMEIRARVSNAELETLLPQVETYTPGPPRSPEEIRRYVSPLLIWASQSPDEVMAEKDIRGRNAFFYWLGQRMEDLSMEHDKRAEYVYRTWNNLRDRSDFSINEALAAARVRNHG
jgi:hypothetical protein